MRGGPRYVVVRDGATAWRILDTAILQLQRKRYTTQGAAARRILKLIQSDGVAEVERVRKIVHSFAIGTLSRDQFLAVLDFPPT